MGEYEKDADFAKKVLDEMMNSWKKQLRDGYVKRLNEINENVKKGKWDPNEALECMTIESALRILDKT